MSSLRRGFTLIELLVTIAIIGTLIGILMPVFGKARARGKLTVCANHLREIGKGFSSYMRDSNDVFPYASFMPSISYGPLDNPPAIYIADVLEPHVGGQLKIFACPDDKDGSERPDPNTGKTYYESERSSYEYRTRPQLGGQTMNEVLKSIAERRGDNLQETTIWIMRDFDNFHAAGGTEGARRYLYYDGHVTDYEN